MASNPPARPPHAPQAPRERFVLDSAHVGDIRGAFGTIGQHEEGARGLRPRALALLAIIGPGLIVMVGDNDAGGVATYSQAGQNYGTSLLWVLLLLVPVLIVNQEMVVRLGAVTGVGHARLINERFGRFWGWFSVGDLFLLGAIGAGALGYTLSGRLTMRMPGWEVISWQVVVFLPLAAVATIVLWPGDVARVPLSAWLGLAYVGLVSQYTAFFVFNAAMAMGGIARVSQIMLLQPFVIVALALPVNGERIDPETVAFAAAVVATVLVGQRMRVAQRGG